jgi:poly(hydroxyalkanoate) depolymerase family esterase
MSRIASCSSAVSRSFLSRHLRSLLRVGSLCLLLGALAPAFAQTEVTGFGSNPGNLRMFKFVPAGLPANAPLVVALHGCSQSAASYDAETGWQMLAGRWQFALLLPQQQSGNNSSTCFNWFTTGDTSRGQGEPLSIRQMVDRMIADHGIAADRVYVTGLSAGGAMASVMLATYPDVFTGGAILSGLPYRCATSQTAAFSCMNPGNDFTPAQWGGKVRAASSWNGAWPIVSIWHGDADYVVRPANLTESMEQWTDVHGIDQTPDVSDTVAGYPHKVYKDAAGTPRVETYTITGMGHGTPVDPGTGETQCGTAGAYILDANICSSYHIGRFWGLDNLDGIAPTVEITAPADGATISGSVTVSATASDDVGVDRVEFLLDGALLGSDATSPYAYAWDAGTASDGAHMLQARAYDLVDNVGTSSPVNVNVTGGTGGGGGDPVTLEFDNEDANDGYVKAGAGGNAPAVGTLEAYMGLATGRGTDGKFNRALLSFDTSAIPDGATITSATLTVGYRSAYGDPWANPAGNSLLIDAHNGCLGACGIEAADWANSTTSTGVAQLLAFNGGSQSSNTFSAAGLAAINKGGRTQLRLRFGAEQTATNYLWIERGAGARLAVTYQP